MLGQVLLPQEDVEAEHPRVLHTLGKDPHVAGALDVVRAADQASRPLHQPLEVDVVAEGQGGLGGKNTQQRSEQDVNTHVITVTSQPKQARLTESETAT